MGGHDVNVGDICGTDRKQCALALAVAAGEHSTEGSETASGVSADLGVDSAKRYHMRLVGDKPTYNKFKYRLSLNKESAREWAELEASSTSTALQLEEFVNKVLESGGKQPTREHEAGTHRHRRARCPRRMDVFHGSFDVGGPARAGRDDAREHG